MSWTGRNRRGWTATREPVLSIVGELAPLFAEHYADIALFKDEIELAPDWVRYGNLERANMLHAVIVRDRARAVVGYCWLIVVPHLHYKHSLTADVDIFWIRPQYRKGMAAYSAYSWLFGFVEDYCRCLKVNRLCVRFKAHKDMGRLFERWGYTPTDRMFAKLL